MENSHSKGHENLEDFIDIDVQLICRLCFSTSNLLPIYGEDNEESQFAFKINTYLPIKVSKRSFALNSLTKKFMITCRSQNSILFL